MGSEERLPANERQPIHTARPKFDEWGNALDKCEFEQKSVAVNPTTED
jgi:hypothetical protein